MKKEEEEVSVCCGFSMIPPASEEELERAGSMWGAYACYICRKCGEVCEPINKSQYKKITVMDIGGLPSKALIEKLVNEDFFKDYGTNGTEESRQQRIIGAKFIITWLVNNQVGEEKTKK